MYFIFVTITLRRPQFIQITCIKNQRYRYNVCKLILVIKLLDYWLLYGIESIFWTIIFASGFFVLWIRHQSRSILFIINPSSHSSRSYNERNLEISNVFRGLLSIKFEGNSSSGSNLFMERRDPKYSRFYLIVITLKNIKSCKQILG